MDSNGYNESIMNTDPDHDFLTGKEVIQTVRHEVYFGPNRKISKEHGFWIYLSPASHRAVHAGDKVDGVSVDMMLKQAVQRCFELWHSRDDFMKLIGRNYL